MSERDIFIAALHKPTPAERAAYLDQVCGGDVALRRRVEVLLQAHQNGGDFLQTPAIEPFATDNVTTVEPGFQSGAVATPRNSAEYLGETLAEPLAYGEDESFAFLAPSSKPGSLGRLGHYEILEVLGRGAFGIVYKAFDEKLHRVVAVKAMAPQLAANGTARQRFLREARAAAAVRHENVIDIHAVDETPVPYLVMEYVAGPTLQEKLRKNGPLEPVEILRIGYQLACGLTAAHAIGLIHRDIKPGNILLENGIHRVKITDFGLARAVDDASLTQSGVVAGTPQYMAPEQARGESVDHRADLFSLGSVLYTLSTGRPPFRAGNTLAVLKRVCEDTPRPLHETNPAIPDWLAAIVAKLQAKNPAERYQSAAEVADLLSKHLTQLQQPEPSVPVLDKPAPAVSPSRRRWPLAVAGVAAVLFGVFAALGISVVLYLKWPRNEPSAKPNLPGDTAEEWYQEIASCVGHTDAVRGAVFSPDGQLLVTAGADKTIRVWDARKGTLLRTLEFRFGDLYAISFSKDGTLLAAGGQDYALMGWEVDTWKESFAVRDHEGWVIRSLAAHNDNFLTAGKTEGYHYWTSEGQDVAGRYNTGSQQGWSVVSSPNDQRIAVGLHNGQIDLWIEPKDETEQPRQVVLTGHKAAVRAVAFSPDGNILASASVDKSIRFWRAEDGQFLAESPGHTGAVLTLAFSPDGKQLASAGSDNTVRLWDVASSQPLGSFVPQRAAVNAVAWSSDGHTLATAAEDGTVKLWRVKPPLPKAAP